MNQALQQECDAVKFAAANRIEGVEGIVADATSMVRAALKGQAFPERATELCTIAATRVRDALLAIEAVATYAQEIDRDGIPVLAASEHVEYDGE